MDPSEGDWRSVGLEYESVGVVPDPYGMLREMHYQFFVAVGEKALNFRRLIDLYIPQQHLILEVPYLKLLSGVCDEQMRG